ncbi:MAG: carbon starvation protein A [Acidobacteriota bacterium]
MPSALILIIAIAFFILGYVFYGRYVAGKLGLTMKNKTPCHTMGDGVDYVPAKWPVLLGHHFASIAGAAPIIGPITAAVFGWIPVFLWIIFGSVFMGAVHDFTSLVASVRHKGRSIGEVIEEHIGIHGKFLFLIFAWFTLVLVVAAFVILVAKTFVSAPEVSTASILFIMLAVVFGLSIYRMKTKLWISTVIGVTLLIFCIWIGNQFPIIFPVTEAHAQIIWTCIILGYIFIASVTPVWILLQPRDYLNSNLLYLILIFSFFGILIANPSIKFPAFSKFVQPGLGSLFPILFVTVACGAISGFHSLVASGTSSKQLNCELDARPVGYGGMLIEGLLAVIALITAIVILPSQYQVFFPEVGDANPITLFANGVGGFISKLGIPAKIGIIFAAMAVAEFALTSLDTATRLGRFTFQEFFRSEKPNPVRNFLTNRFAATFCTILPGGILALSGSYQAIWPIFGSANQLLAALALLTVSVWLAKKHVKNHFVRYPMFIMFTITLSALGVLVYNKSKLIIHFLSNQPVPASFNLVGTCFLLLVALMLFAVAVSLVYQAVKSLKKVD